MPSRTPSSDWSFNFDFRLTYGFEYRWDIQILSSFHLAKGASKISHMRYGSLLPMKKSFHIGKLHDKLQHTKFSTSFSLSLFTCGSFSQPLRLIPACVLMMWWVLYSFVASYPALRQTSIHYCCESFSWWY